MSRTVAKLLATAGLSSALLMGATGVANAEWPPRVDGIPGTPVTEVPGDMQGLPAHAGTTGSAGSHG